MNSTNVAAIISCLKPGSVISSVDMQPPKDPDLSTIRTFLFARDSSAPATNPFIPEPTII